MPKNMKREKEINMDYTEQIVAACEDALRRFPDMPELLRDAMIEFILTGVICDGGRAADNIYREGAREDVELVRRHALLRAMPSVKPDHISWRNHLKKYYEYVEEYEQLKNTTNP